ncbi:MAG: glycoside hydrolase family 3 N-terminal domain-containing protein [Candidatus Devosia phytovorans]|uniref:beta-N-acetylhexosaminidase n=1 Tax=Candidatus Devosia phytovorans TaxID=3121372 RepID=A0AAJ5VZ29_9HYPH|nr:glycoside hydrolase family 3 N-terminal domain-containing protein [Devosia sp.]WEK06835.1 MAG: glycoside hydrolase family 3 N-terminal domain-containing protein [Devosia sp.]
MAWVAATREALTPRDKLAQLFVLLARGTAEETAETVRSFKPGGITRIYSDSLEAEVALARDLGTLSAIPLLVSADLEGSRMSLPFGTAVPNPLGLAAVDDVAATSAISTIMAQEARAVGLNWSFTPVIDINAAWRSAIVGTRSYGSDIERVERHAMAQVEAFQANGVAATVKHWPGEGYDDRDQHLVTTVNPLSMAEWEASFGRLYRKAIAGGVLSIMSAHIALPAYALALDPGAGAEAYRPASLSKILNQDLLRRELGFNGLIVSDATPMAGMGDWGPRDAVLPDVIISGCDVILFSDDPNADLMRLVKAVADGRLSQERVDEAVTRVLALKAALGLHRERPEPSMEEARRFVATDESLIVSRGVTERVPTLVKDVRNILPLSRHKTPRVLVYSTGVVLPFAPEPIPLSLPELLAKEGFAVTVFEPGQDLNAKDFDLVLYLLAEETLLTRSRIFLDWKSLTGSVFGAMHRVWHDMPVLMISFGYPYYLHDAPRVPAYVNAYGSSEAIQAAVLEAIMGRSNFSGSSPVDPFVGSEQGKY